MKEEKQNKIEAWNWQAYERKYGDFMASEEEGEGQEEEKGNPELEEEDESDILHSAKISKKRKPIEDWKPLYKCDANFVC